MVPDRISTPYRDDAYPVNVRNYGAKGDGATDDTAAIMAADADARTAGRSLILPAGTYLGSQLVLQTGSSWLGEGRDKTVLRQVVGANRDFIYGANSSANWGSSNPTNLVNGSRLEGLTIDGNWNTGAGNTSGSGIALFGSRPILRDLFIKNVAEHGMRTEYTDAAQGLDSFAMEGSFERIRIDTTGKHGWWHNGPHDSNVFDVIVVDAGQAAANTWDGILCDVKSGSRFVGAHVWSRGSSVRMRHSLNLQGGGNELAASHFEGAYTAPVGIYSTKNVLDSSCSYYAAWNGVTILMGGTATTNIIRGKLDSAGAGRPNPVGIKMGSQAGDFVASNIIDVMALNQTGGVVDFAFTGGANTVRVRGFQTSGVSVLGTPNATDTVEILMSGVSRQDYNTVAAGRMASSTVAQLNAMGPAAGWVAFASDGRKTGEGAGLGTGVPVYWSASGWRSFSTDAIVST